MMTENSNKINMHPGMGAAARSFLLYCLFPLFVFFLFIAPSFSAESQNAGLYGYESTGGEYLLGPGDVLEVNVFGEPEVSSSAVVRTDGRISLPLAGELNAAGITPDELSGSIRKRLEKFIETPEVSVILSEARPKSYYILGQVESPGEYDITRPVTVLQAIARAGGFLEWAKKGRIMVVGEPGTEEKITLFNYDAFLKNPDRTQNVILQPGDTIVVP